MIDLDGQPWFIAGDVLDILGCGKTNRWNWMSKLDASEKGKTLVMTPGGQQALLILAESGLYKMILRSDNPQALAFQDWVTRVVLPAIRKDGAYIKGEEKVVTGEMSD